MSYGKRTGTLKQDVMQPDGSTKEQTLDCILPSADTKKGWNMIYKDPLYDFIEKLTKAEFKLYRLLEGMILSRGGKDMQIIGTDIAKEDTVSIVTQEDTKFESIEDHISPTNDPKAISKMLSTMVRNNIIMEVSPKHYKYNPFILVPSFTKGEDAEMLQKNWQTTQNSGSFKRRGRNILDEYLDDKKKTNNNKLTFADWLKDNENIAIEPLIVKGTIKKKESVEDQDTVADNILD